MKDMEAWMEHNERLNDLDRVQHRFILRQYINYLLSKHDDLDVWLRKKGLWDKWKKQRESMTPEFDEMVSIASYCREQWDWDEYRKIYVNSKIDAFKNNKDQITSYGDELEEIRKTVKKIESTINKLETKVKALYNRIF